MHARALLFSSILIASQLYFGAARAEVVCPADTAKAVESARSALQSNEPEQDHIALECLVRAVEALDRKVSDLIRGKIEFTGDIIAKSFLYSNAPKASQ